MMEITRVSTPHCPVSSDDKHEPSSRVEMEYASGGQERKSRCRCCGETIRSFIAEDDEGVYRSHWSEWMSMREVQA